MASILPVLFIVIAGLGLLVALVALWHSARAVAGDTVAPGERRIDPGAERGRLLEQKQMLLRSLKDLELEHDLGKLSDADYERLTEHYRGQARHVLRDLDDQTQPHRKQARKLVEARVKRALGKQAKTKAKDTEKAAKARETTGAEPTTAEAQAQAEGAAVVASEATLRCEACETLNDSDAAFCKKCGARLEQLPASAPAAERGTA